MQIVHSRSDNSMGPAVISWWQYEAEVLPLLRSNAALRSENEQLRSDNAALTGSAEVWIRLYEQALARAQQAESLLVALGGR